MIFAALICIDSRFDTIRNRGQNNPKIGTIIACLVRKYSDLGKFNLCVNDFTSSGT